MLIIPRVKVATSLTNIRFVTVGTGQFIDTGFGVFVLLGGIV